MFDTSNFYGMATKHRIDSSSSDGYLSLSCLVLMSGRGSPIGLSG